MAAWAIASRNDKVLDPCCGTSTLLTKSVERLCLLGASLGGAANQAYGIEISKETIKAARRILVAKFGHAVPHLTRGDFLSVNPDNFQKVDAVVCNPPFMRHQRISTSRKKKLARDVRKTSGFNVQRTSDLYVYFMLHAIQFLRDGGRMAFLCPTQYMETDYGEALRDYLARHLRIHAIIIFDENQRVFPNSLSTASLILFEKSKLFKNAKTNVIHIEELPSNVNFLKDGSTKVIRSGVSRKVDQASLESGKWTTQDTFHIREQPGFLALGDLMEVKRGIATGANKFFALSEPRRRELGIALKYVRPIIAKATFSPRTRFGRGDWRRLQANGAAVWLLNCGDFNPDTLAAPLRTYLRKGRRLHLHERYLLERRNPWYAQEVRKPPAVLFTYMSNGNPRFILNATGCIPLNNLHCLYPKKHMRTMEVKALLAFLNSDFVRTRLRHFGRRYGNGLLKLEPRELNLIPVPKPERLGMAATLKLAKMFDELSATHSEREASKARRSIDRYIRTRVFRRLSPPT